MATSDLGPIPERDENGFALRRESETEWEYQDRKRAGNVLTGHDTNKLAIIAQWPDSEDARELAKRMDTPLATEVASAILDPALEVSQMARGTADGYRKWVARLTASGQRHEAETAEQLRSAMRRAVHSRFKLQPAAIIELLRTFGYAAKVVKART